MLSKDKIKEAESNVRAYLEEGLLKKAVMDKAILNIFLNQTDLQF